MQSALTYQLNLLQILNEWLYNLNKSIATEFTDTNLIKTYIFEYPMYSDIFYLDKSKKPKLTLYNETLLKVLLPTLTYQEKNKIIKNCKLNIELLTNDILAILNVFKHFVENSAAVDYIKTTGNNFDNKKYVYEIFLNKHNLLLQNYFDILLLFK